MFINDAFADKEGSHSINQILKDMLSLPFVPRRLGMLNIKTTTRMNYVTVLEKLAQFVINNC